MRPAAGATKNSEMCIRDSFKIMNSDLMKPTFNDLLGAPESNPMTTTHMNYMMNPIFMLFNKLFDRFLPWLDKYDFDATKLNSKIGFWGSRFAIGIYLGVFVGLLAHQTPTPVSYTPLDVYKRQRPRRYESFRVVAFVRCRVSPMTSLADSASQPK